MQIGKVKDIFNYRGVASLKGETLWMTNPIKLDVSYMYVYFTLRGKKAAKKEKRKEENRREHLT